jgi:hypothetical protein
MGQSEVGYLNQKRREQFFETAASCEMEGVVARQRGRSSTDNPFLVGDGSPRTTNEDEVNWFRKCDAWWRGWDREDLRRSRAPASISIDGLQFSAPQL